VTIEGDAQALLDSVEQVADWNAVLEG
jgi:hypothetical protein